MYFKYAQPVVKYADCAKGQFTPHESDCTKYYQCLADGYLEVACPNGLHWNQGIMGCDWPANAGCDPSAAQSQGEYVTSKLIMQWSYTLDSLKLITPEYSS